MTDGRSCRSRYPDSVTASQLQVQQQDNGILSPSSSASRNDALLPNNRPTSPITSCPPTDFTLAMLDYAQADVKNYSLCCSTSALSSASPSGDENEEGDSEDAHLWSATSPAEVTVIFPSPSSLQVTGVPATSRANQRYVCQECGKHYATVCIT